MTQKEKDNLASITIDLAKNSPQKLPARVTELYENEDINRMNNLMPSVLWGLIDTQDLPTIEIVLPRIVKIVSEHAGVQASYNLLARMEVMLHFRKPSIGIYDHTFHIIGGGQKYGCTIAYALQNDFNVTLIANRNISHQDLKSWYDLDLTPCKIKVLSLPFFEEKGIHEIDPLAVSVREENPFHLISRESGNYDIFINNSMLEMVYPLSVVSVLTCHFPERRRSRYFYADRYTYVVNNSEYTAEWIRKKWKMNATTHIYPPVDMHGSEQLPHKENIILSVARFENGGSKQQLEMAKAFVGLVRTNPEVLKNWRLILAGGSASDNPYLQGIEEYLASERPRNIDLRVNIPLEELKSLYERARIFWHFCGLYQSDPSLVEHFGMSIVEAMQNWCVPVVFDGGGQTEIVEQGISGYRFSSLKELKAKTLKVINDDALWQKLSDHARTRGMVFTKDVFIERVKKLFEQIMATYFVLPSDS
jgi:glycosyltransferase involved in cell wall biosynthesis